MKSFRQYLLEYSLGPNHPDFGKPNFGIPKDPPPPRDDDEIKATIRNRNGVQLASSDHPSGLTVKSAMVDGTYMFGIYYGKPLLHEVIMGDGRVKHVHQINPATGEHFILESETDKVESLLVRHLSAHVHDSDGNPTGRTVHEHHTSPEG
jgi:hypothetical protein